MDRKQLLELREVIEGAVIERQAAGEFDANSRHMLLLLKSLLALIDHAITQYPWPGKK